MTLHGSNTDCIIRLKDPILWPSESKKIQTYSERPHFKPNLTVPVNMRWFQRGDALGFLLIYTLNLVKTFLVKRIVHNLTAVAQYGHIRLNILCVACINNKTQCTK